MASPQLSTTQTRLPSIKEMFPEHLLPVRQTSFSPPVHHRDISQHYSQHSGSSTPPSHRRTLPLSHSSYHNAPASATHIPRALASPMAQACHSSTYQGGYPASISRTSSPTPPMSSSTTLKSGLTEHRSPPKRLNSQIYSFDVLKSDPSSNSLQHIASSATFPHRNVPSTCQSTSAGLANGSTPVFRVNVASTPASPRTQSATIIKGHHVTHQHSPRQHQQPMPRRHSIAVCSNDNPTTHGPSSTTYASGRPSSLTHSHAPSGPSDRSHYSSILSFSRPDYNTNHPRSYLHQGRPAGIHSDSNRSIGQDREQSTAKHSEPITIGVRRTDAPAGISNGNRPFSVGGNGLGFGFGFGDGHSHGNTSVNGNNGNGATNGGTGKKHICPTCSKKFNRPSSLKIHVNTHTGATPFRCPFPNCGREFNVNSNMRRHYRNHGSPGLVRSSSAGDNDLALAEDNSDENRRRRRQLSDASFPAVDMDMSIISSVAPATSHGKFSRPVDLSANTVSPNGAYTFVVGSLAVRGKRRKLDDAYFASVPKSIPSPPPSSGESGDESDVGEQMTAPHRPSEDDVMERGRRSSRVVGYMTSAARTSPRGERADNRSPRYPSRSRSRSRSGNMVTGSSSSFPYSSATSTASSVLSASLPSTPASVSASPPPPMKSNYSQDGKARDHLYSPSEPYSKSFVDLQVSTALRPAFGEFQHHQSGTPPRDYAQHRHSRRDEHNPYPTRGHPPPRRWPVSGAALKEDSARAW